MYRSALALSLVLLLAPDASFAGTATSVSSPGERLLEAAQQQDIATVRKLLESGVNVNFKSRYGATALLFAVDKGNLEIVGLLLENGAEVDVKDTFYKATPVTWALFSLDKSPVHKEIVLLLLKQESTAAPDILGAGARIGDMDLVRAAIESGQVEPAALRSALNRAQEDGHEEIVAYLALRVPEESAEEAPSIPLQVLSTYVGDYKNSDIGMIAKVFVAEETLKLQGQGQPALSLSSTGERSFTARDEDGIDLRFRVRGDLVEGFELRQGGRELYFARFDPAADAGGTPAELAAIAELPLLPEPKRSKPIQWPSFRGPGASGIGDGQGVPFTWNGEGGDNVLWKTEIPGLALSSPVISGDRVFVSTAVSSGDDAGLRIGLYGDVDSVEDDSQHAWKVYSLSKATGEILWVRTASTGAPKVKRHQKSSHANPTPVTDGKHLIVHFPSEGLFCFDFDGNLMWKQDLGVLSSGWFYDPTYQWGFGSSPILYEGKVIIQVDIQRGSFIAAFDAATGEVVWRTDRDEIPTWGTPVVLPGRDGGPDEIVTNGTTIRGYDVDTGEELWTLSPNSEVTVASPVVADGIAYVTGGYPPVKPIYALRPGGRGDLSLPEDATASETIVWSHNRGGVYMPTPLVYQGVLYLLQNNGRLTAYDAATGEEIYRHRVGSAESFSSSPIAADGRLLFTSEDGSTFVVRAGRTFELLETNELGEIVMATPAISDGILLIRSDKHLWALGRGGGGTGEDIEAR